MRCDDKRRRLRRKSMKRWKEFSLLWLCFWNGVGWGEGGGVQHMSCCCSKWKAFNAAERWKYENWKHFIHAHLELDRASGEDFPAAQPLLAWSYIQKSSLVLQSISFLNKINLKNPKNIPYNQQALPHTWVFLFPTWCSMNTGEEHRRRTTVVLR